MAISISLQAIALAAILLTPLLVKPAPIAWTVVPVPPYYSHAAQPRTPTTPIVHHRQFKPTGLVTPTFIPRTINMKPEPPEPPGDPTPAEGQINMTGLIPATDSRGSVQPPPPPPTQPKTPKVVHLSQIDASRLVYRIEPAYPVLMKQIGRSGKVELHAMIGEDGTIQSLEAVGGDPGFFASAMQAVKQWRYTPTMLNGQAVKVDTYITVIYNIAR